MYVFKGIIFGNRKPSQEVLAEYSRKVEFMKGLIDTEKLVSKIHKSGVFCSY